MGSSIWSAWRVRSFGTQRSSTRWGVPGAGLVTLSLLVGAGAALFAVVFRFLIHIFTLALTGYGDYAGVAGAANPHLPALGRWFVIGTPVVAGIIYGPIVHAFAREARGHGVPEVMFAVAKRGGRIKPQVAAVKALASALCIGGGGSVGREGPIVQIGSAIGSTLGRIVKLPEPRLRVLVACGAAGGIAATFNAPLAGVFFAMEIILSDFVAEAFGMVVIASVTSAVIGRALLGNSPFLSLPGFTVEHPQEYLLFAALGVLAGVVGVVFTRVLYWIEDGCDAIWRGPEWLRPAVGGLALGLVLLVLPEMYGVGYPVLGNAVDGRYAVLFLLVLLVGKMVATSLTIGIGGSGGVFAPSLFIGATLGSAFGQIAHSIVPGSVGPAGEYALVGMGAVFAGSARAPITAVVIMFELTGEYSIILPLMVAIVIATGVSHRISPDTIYTLKLRRRGVDLGTRETIPQAHRRLGELMQQPPDAVTADLALTDASALLARSPYGVLPVLADDGRCLGVITARAATEAVTDGDEVTPADLAVEPSGRVDVDTTVDDAVHALDVSGLSALPVLDADDRLVGWFDYRDALLALNPTPTSSSGPSAPAATPTAGASG